MVIISEALGGGVRRHIVDILERLDKDKFDIYFIYNLYRADKIMKEKMPYIESLGIKLIQVDKFYRDISINDIYAFRSIYKHIKKINPDIVHCHSSKAGVLGRVAAKLLGVGKIYYTPHAYVIQNPNISNLKKNVFIYIEKFLSRQCTTKTINVSNGEREFAISLKLDKAEKFKVIYNGVNIDLKTNDKDLETLKNEFNLDDKDFVVGTIARMDEQKDPYSFLRIVKETVEINNNIKFIYVGEGSLFKDIANEIDRLGIEKNIVLTGFRDDTYDILNIFDLFLTTALYEGMPYSLIEAISMKLPIIATNVTGNNEIVDMNKNGFLFEINDIALAVKYIGELVLNRKKNNEMSKYSFDKYCLSYKIDNMINKYEDLYLK